MFLLAHHSYLQNSDRSGTKIFEKTADTPYFLSVHDGFF